MINIYSHINSVYNSITYILSISDMPEAWLIDCGDAGDTIKWAEKNSKIISGVFLTHTHYDHIYGLNELKASYPEIKIYTSKYGINGLSSPKLNMSFYFDEIEDYIYKFDGVIGLKQSDIIQLWPNIELEVIETSGHDASCLSYKVKDYLFTGDSYIPGIKTVTTFPQSNKEDANISEKLITDLVKRDNMIVYCGHSVDRN